MRVVCCLCLSLSGYAQLFHGLANLSCISCVVFPLVFELGGVVWGPDGMPCVVLRRPEALECRGFSLHRLGVDLPVTRTVWDSNLGPPATENRSLATELSVPLLASTILCLHAYKPHIF